MTLTEFLLARIADDENTAACAGHGNGLVFHDWNAEWVQVELPDNARPIYDVRHIRTFSPERVLAECEAKRRIVDEHESREVASLDRETWAQTFTVCGRCRVGERQIVAPCPTLRLLALPYADHPDYDQSWRP